MDGRNIADRHSVGHTDESRSMQRFAKDLVALQPRSHSCANRTSADVRRCLQAKRARIPIVFRGMRTIPVEQWLRRQTYSGPAAMSLVSSTWSANDGQQVAGAA